MYRLLGSKLCLAPVACILLAPAVAPAADEPDDWPFLQSFVPAYNRTWTSPPLVETPNTVFAPVLGNGDMVGCIGGNEGVQTYYLRKSDFWTDNGSASEIPAGCLRISDASNLIENRKALTASSEISSDQDPTKVFDGLTSTKWCTKDPEPHWLAVDLGGVCPVSRWVVKHCGANGDAVNCNTRDFKLQKSDDGTNWTDVDGVTGNTANVTDRNVKTFQARHVRLYVTRATSENSDNHARIHEFRVYREPRAGSADPDTAKTAYRQEENILDAEVRSDVPVHHGKLEIVSYIAATENTLVAEVTNRGSAAVRVKAELSDEVLQRSTYPAAAGVNGEVFYLTRQTRNRPGARWISRVGMATRVFGASSVTYAATEASRSSATFDLPPGGTATVVTCMSGGKNATTHLEDAKARIAKLNEPGVVALKTVHRRWWKDQWWLRAYVRTYDDTVDAYYFRCLYQLGTMCREGLVNSGLHGPWKTSDQLHNFSSFCSNDLGAASYYLPLITANRASTAKTWIDTCYDWIPEGRRRAKADAGLKRGILFPVHWAPWGSIHSDVYHGQKFCAAYDSLVGNWYFQRTGDVECLREKVYPFMRECADFYEDWLKKEPDGKYHTRGASFESSSDNYENSCLDMVLAGIVFTDIVKYSEILGVDAERRAKWQDIRDHLNDYSTTTFNGKKVYQADNITPFNNSINVIQTQIVYPGYACNRFSPPAVRQIGFDTIQQAAVVGGWSQDNMVGQGFYPAAQRIGGFDVEQLIGNFKRMLVHNRYIDFPNFIAGASLWEFSHQLCIQAYDQGLLFFPDFPPARSAKFVRLRMPGAFLVSGEFADGEARNLMVHSELGNACRVLNPWGPARGMEVRELGGGAVPTTQETAGSLLTRWRARRTVWSPEKAGRVEVDRSRAANEC